MITFTAGSVLGPTVITYQVGDPDGGVSTGRLLIQIVEPNPLPPIAVDDFASIVGPGVATRIDVLANDADPDTPTAADRRVGDQDQRDGTVTFGRGVVTLTPAADFVGDLVATYQISDDDGLSDTATVTFTVLEPLNRAPIARDDTAATGRRRRRRHQRVFNDDEPDGDPLDLSITAGPDPALGSAQVRPGGIIRFRRAGAVGPRRSATRSTTANYGQRRLAGVDPALRSAPPDAPNVFLQTAYMQPIAVDLTAYARNGEIVDVGAPLPAARVSSRRRPARTATSCSTTRCVNVCRRATPARSRST